RNIAGQRRRQQAVSVGKERRDAVVRAKRLCRVDHNDEDGNIVETDFAMADDIASLEDLTVRTVEELKSAASFTGKESFQKKMEVLRRLRRLLSQTSMPPVEIAVQAGVVPVLVRFLSFGSANEQLLEAAWCITNIATGDVEQTRALLPALPMIIAHLGEPQRSAVRGSLQEARTTNFEGSPNKARVWQNGSRASWFEGVATSKVVAVAKPQRKNENVKGLLKKVGRNNCGSLEEIRDSHKNRESRQKPWTKLKSKNEVARGSLENRGQRCLQKSWGFVKHVESKHELQKRREIVCTDVDAPAKIVGLCTELVSSKVVNSKRTNIRRRRRVGFYTSKICFFSVKLQEGGSLSEHLLRMKDLRDQLASINKPVDDDDMVALILNSLPFSYDSFVEALHLMGESQTLTFDKVSSYLLQKERRQTQVQESSSGQSESAFAAQSKGKWKRQADASPSSPKFPVKCYYCHKLGHVKKDCQKRLSALKKRKGQAHVATVEQHESEDEYALMASCSDGGSPTRCWFFDSGASRHFTCQRDWYVTFHANSCSSDSVTLGDGRSHAVEGIGDVRIMLNNNTKLLVKSVRYVPNMNKNLLSISQLTDNPHISVNFSGKQCIVSDVKHNKVVALGIGHGGLYRLVDPATVNLHALVVVENTSVLWHERYGHLNLPYLARLHKDNMVVGLPPIQEKQDMCVGCFAGKQKRKPFPHEGVWRAKGLLDLVHADLCEPSWKTPTVLGARYFLLLVDDHSRRMWIYLLKKKSDCFASFVKFKALVENQTSRQIKTLRSDNGGEFTSKQFAVFCEKEGIQHQLTAPYTPQQNGVVERRNRTIMEMARCMMHSRGVPYTYWGEAVNTTVYILNRSPCKALQEITPEEAWSKIKPEVSAFRIFGSAAYTLVPDRKRSKLDSKSSRYFFAGYSDHSKAYRLIDTSTNKIIISRDVDVKETESFFGCNQQIDQQHGSDQQGVVTEIGSLSLPDDESGHSHTPPQTPVQSMLSPTESFSSPGNQLALVSPPEVPLASESSVQRRPKWYYSTIQDLTRDDLSPLLDGRSRRPGERIDYSEQAQFALASDLLHIREPQKYSDARGIPEWETAMQIEYDALIKNDTWKLVPLPPGKHPIGCKWVYKIKCKADGTLDKYKARLVAKGFSQQEGIDYEETFAPTAKMVTFRLLLAFAAQFGWKIYQMDVKSAFLNGDLEEEVYMTQPEGFQACGREHLVCRLIKSLYGLKQAPRAWYIKIDTHLRDSGFKRSHSDPNLYVKSTNDDIVILIVYVDDLAITGSGDAAIHKVKSDLCTAFDMTDLGLLHYCLGVEFWQQDHLIFISQVKYATNLLQKFKMYDCNSSSTPMEVGLKLSAHDDSPPVDETLYRQLVGSLIYLTTTRPDLCFAVSYLSRFLSKPKLIHWGAAKRVLRYVKGTLDFGILYQRVADFTLIGYTDSDWGGSVDTRRSTTGYIFSLGSGVISWQSKLQPTVAISSTEAEYKAVVSAGCEAVWLRQILVDFQFSQVTATPLSLFCDNQGVLKMVKNPIYHARTKHIEIHHHYIRQLVDSGEISLHFCPSQEQSADVMTKPLGAFLFVKFRDKLGIVSRSGDNFRQNLIVTIQRVLLSLSQRESGNVNLMSLQLGIRAHAITVTRLGSSRRIVGSGSMIFRNRTKSHVMRNMWQQLQKNEIRMTGMLFIVLQHHARMTVVPVVGSLTLVHPHTFHVVGTVEGIGDICIVLNNAHKLLVRNVRYVPSLQKNLLSIRQLTENPNIYVDLCGKKCVVSDVKQRRIIALGIGEGGQYRLVDLAAINMNARVEDNSTIQDVQEVAMPWEEAIPHKSVDLDTVNLHAPIVEGVSTIPDVREADMPWEDGFPHSKEQFVVDGDSTIPNALTVHGEMACPTTHSEVLARRTVEHEQFAHCVVKGLSQQRGIDEQIDRTRELVLTPTIAEMVISPTTETDETYGYFS
ncbi:hypothetical protein KI387_042879, partial [Taxus chinensis]